MKINRLLQKIPQGAVVTTVWLASSNQVRMLAGSGRLQRVGYGAYCQSGHSLNWQSAVFALQASDDSGLPTLLPGGQTVLALHGFVYYLARHAGHT
ncbi:AbiEi antitoxin N-terminal domain-containing protein [Halomonas sp. A29]|uniref:AbiEi antitoxin N-terminal domain-containing protein n=1 Tax=Halomonas sp. A29 TaxID=3102786 RepID=UPI00398AC54F